MKIKISCEIDTCKQSDCEDALDKFREKFPGVWERILELFGPWPEPQDSGPN